MPQSKSTVFQSSHEEKSGDQSVMGNHVLCELEKVSSNTTSGDNSYVDLSPKNVNSGNNLGNVTMNLQNVNNQTSTSNLLNSQVWPWLAAK